MNHPINIAEADPKTHIIIKGARVHNLKNLDVAIPRKKLVVITGLSGSGKSSLAFDTLYAEGQRRYVESLSSYARQFLGRMNKPEVDFILGISPAVAIEQKVNSTNPRSTVGTSTEVYDYLKLLYARVGKTFSPVSGLLVQKHTPEDVVKSMNQMPIGTAVSLYAPLDKKNFDKTTASFITLQQQGFSRLRLGSELKRMDEWVKADETIGNKKIHLLIDRFSVNKADDDTRSRMYDSVQTAFFEGNNTCLFEWKDNSDHVHATEMNNRFEADGIEFEEPSVNLFTFNNPYGACKKCEGFGSVIGIDEDLVIPDKSLSIFESAIVPWKGEKMSEWKDAFIKKAIKYDFPLHRAYYDLSDAEKELLWRGNKDVQGIDDFFKFIEEQAYKIQYRVMLSRYRGKTVCPDCKGTRLRKDANYVKVNGASISELVLMSIDKLQHFFESLHLNEYEEQVAKRIVLEIKNRLNFLCDVGLGYLTLNRLSSTLSGGESQRINLATSLGSSLVGSLYILDEPSIGLHSRDTIRLIGVLKRLRDLGNTVIVVEHDEEMMRQADQIIDIGPMAGSHGGELVFQGNQNDLLLEEKSMTAKYLTGKLSIEVREHAHKWRNSIVVKGARQNNLKNVNARFPLNVLTVVTGVSGSGKSTLVNKILYPALKKMYQGYSEQTGQFDRIEGDYKLLQAIEYIDQNPIGKSSRSNPVTYVKAYDEIRTLYANQPLSKSRSYKPSVFSFNVEGGRCEECEGEGFVTISMQFMADIKLQCEVCGGKRFKDETLEVEYLGKNINDILTMTVDDAIAFFKRNTKQNSVELRILNKLQPLADVGLGYVKLGQASSTLSGGEAQRIKLASFLTKGDNHPHTLFIFDEPTTGLHFHDINKLLDAFKALINQGHSLIVIEHNTDVIRCADWVIDLGPEGGDGGGEIIFEGTPEDLMNCEKSYTGQYLKSHSHQIIAQ